MVKKTIKDYGKAEPTSNNQRPNPQIAIDKLMFNLDRESHIKLNQASCQQCADKSCLRICPAGMFTKSADGQEIIYSHEGCLECGTCYLICPELSWDYPKAGCGVIYRES